MNRIATARIAATAAAIAALAGFGAPALCSGMAAQSPATHPATVVLADDGTTPPADTDATNPWD